MTLADAFTTEIRRTWIQQTQVFALAIGALGIATYVDQLLVWVVACAFVLLLVMSSVILVWRRRRLRQFQIAVRTPGALLAFADEHRVLTLWLRTGERIDVRGQPVDLGAFHRVESNEERTRLDAYGRAQSLVTDIEREFDQSSLVAELAQKDFHKWQRAWNELSPWDCDTPAIEGILSDLFRQVRGARAYESSVGQRAMIGYRDVHQIQRIAEVPFIGQVAFLLGRLFAQLESRPSGDTLK